MMTNVGATTLVGEERMNSTVAVAVGDGVSVLRVGVIVTVGVDVGIAATVCVNAAFAVCAMNWFTWFASAVGKGVAKEGVHAMTRARIAIQNRNFLVRVDISPLPHPKRIGMLLSMVFQQ